MAGLAQAAALVWLGRRGTIAVAVSILLGIALPPLGALIRPYFAETVFALLCLALLRVDPSALRAQLRRTGTLGHRRGLDHAGGADPARDCLVAAGLLDNSPALLLALMLNAVAPPISPRRRWLH